MHFSVSWNPLAGRLLHVNRSEPGLLYLDSFTKTTSVRRSHQKMQSLNAILPDQSGRVRQAAKYAATVLFAGLITPAFMTAAALSGNLSLSSAGADTIAVNGSVIDFDYSGGVTSSFPPLATGTV